MGRLSLIERQIIEIPGLKCAPPARTNGQGSLGTWRRTSDGPEPSGYAAKNVCEKPRRSGAKF